MKGEVTVITKYSILDYAAALDPPLRVLSIIDTGFARNPLLL